MTQTGAATLVLWRNLRKKTVSMNFLYNSSLEIITSTSGEDVKLTECLEVCQKDIFLHLDTRAAQLFLNTHTFIPLWSPD